MGIARPLLSFLSQIRQYILKSCSVFYVLPYKKRRHQRQETDAVRMSYVCPVLMLLVLSLSGGEESRVGIEKEKSID